MRVGVMRRVFGEGFMGNFEDEHGKGLERWGGEEMGGEGRFGGGEEVSEAFVDGYFVD